MSFEAQEYSRTASYAEYAIDLDKVYYRHIIEQVGRLGNSDQSARLLDVGCFDGSLAAQFKPGYEVYGLEGNVRACEAAQKRGVRASLHDLEKPFPFENNFFDCIIAAEIIEHVYDTDFFLQEIRRCLRPGGLLVMSVPNTACLSNRFKLLFGGYPRYAEYRAGGAGHIRIYTATAIRDQVKENGFRIIWFAGCNLPLPMHNRFIPKWIKKAAVRGGVFFPTIAGQVILSARKPHA